MGQRVGCAVRRRTADDGPPARGVRRLSHPHRCTDRASPRRARRGGHLDNHRAALLGQRCERRGGVEGSANEHRFTARIPESLPTTSPSTTMGRVRTYNTTHGGGMAATRPTGSGALHWLAGRGRPRRALASGIDARSGVRSQLVHVNDLWPRWPSHRDRAPRRRRRVTQQRIDGSSIRPPLGPGRTRPRSSSTSRCSVPARSSTMAGRRQPTTSRPACSTRRIWRSGAGTSARTAGAVQAADDFSESHDVASASRVVGTSGGLARTGRRDNVLPIDDTLVQRLGAFSLLPTIRGIRRVPP